MLGRTFSVRHWWDRIDDGVILGAMPMASDAVKLKQEGVTGVINMCQEYAGPIAKYQELGIEQLHLPTIDFQPPSLDDIRRGVSFIHRHVQQHGTVYIHCKAGRARSATVLLCYLVAHQGMTPQQAQSLMLEKRPHVNPQIAQREVVKAFCAELPTVADRSVGHSAS